MKTLICDCNRTMPLDAKALRSALAATPGASADGLDTTHSVLCRREAPAFQRAARDTGASGDELLVACTQESRLFVELNEQTAGAAPVSVRPIRFVNIRETGGWAKGAEQAMPKIAALIATAQLPAPEPVATVSYHSAGRVLVIAADGATAGAGAQAENAAALLADALDVSLLVTGGAAIAQPHEHAVHAGRLTRLAGWLGRFEAEWDSSNPIDLDLCTRCNACIRVCPEGAIDFGYQIDLARCTSQRDCVRACEAAGAIDFARPAQVLSETFDLVLDLRAAPAWPMHQLPQGYFHVGTGACEPGSERALAAAVIALRGLTGTFEKPKFFHYQQRLCAHSRNEQIGCTACIDVCSASAISSDASQKGRLRGLKPAAGKPAGAGNGVAAGTPNGGVKVEPHLCVGCGACTTVCPSGALTFAYPGPVDQGRRLRTLLTAYTQGGGRDAALLLHSEGAGSKAIDALGRAARVDRRLAGVPPRVLPLALWHTASVGLDLWLAAIAHGAVQVWVLLTDEEARQYRDALAGQMALGEAILQGLGYAGTHFRLIDAAPKATAAAPAAAALDAALQAPAAQGVARRATFAVQADKRPTLDMAIDHLAAVAPRQPIADEIALPAAGAPFGSLVVDTDKCTLCLACVGACPEAALADNPDRPQLKFIEKNCVQCGLCATTCPEGAITLQPRLWLADGGRARKAPRVLNEATPFCCVRCGKPFGTLRAIDNMLQKLAGHAAFQGAAAERLKMCSDCRVIDLYSAGDEVRALDLPR